MCRPRIMIESVWFSPSRVRLGRKFFNVLEKHAILTEQKRFYMSTYGFKNSREVILGEQDTLEKAENYDRFSVDQIISWWRKKAARRFESLKEDGRLRTKLETWNTNPDEIDIIR